MVATGDSSIGSDDNDLYELLGGGRNGNSAAATETSDTGASRNGGNRKERSTDDNLESILSGGSKKKKKKEQRIRGNSPAELFSSWVEIYPALQEFGDKAEDEFPVQGAQLEILEAIGYEGLFQTKEGIARDVAFRANLKDLETGRLRFTKPEDIPTSLIVGLNKKADGRVTANNFDNIYQSGVKWAVRTDRYIGSKGSYIMGAIAGRAFANAGKPPKEGEDIPFTAISHVGLGLYGGELGLYMWKMSRDKAEGESYLHNVKDVFFNPDFRDGLVHFTVLGYVLPKMAEYAEQKGKVTRDAINAKEAVMHLIGKAQDALPASEDDSHRKELAMAGEAVAADIQGEVEDKAMKIYEDMHDPKSRVSQAIYRVLPQKLAGYAQKEITNTRRVGALVIRVAAAAGWNPALLTSRMVYGGYRHATDTELQTVQYNLKHGDKK